MTDGANPWVSRPANPEPTATHVAVEPVQQPSGPTAPQRGIPAPSVQLPIVDRAPLATLCWLGVHGGAGESSLSQLVPNWPAAGHMWPHAASPTPTRVVLVARSSMSGLQAAQAAATQWAAGLVPNVEVLGLAIVADAPGRLPRPLRDFARLVSGGVPRTWSVPWIESWRLGEPISLPDAPREVRRMVDELNTLTQTGAVGTTD